MAVAMTVAFSRKIKNLFFLVVKYISANVIILCEIGTFGTGNGWAHDDGR